jgi:hypothetical protein
MAGWSCAQGLLLFSFQILPAFLLVYFLVRFITGTADRQGSAHLGMATFLSTRLLVRGHWQVRAKR